MSTGPGGVDHASWLHHQRTAARLMTDALHAVTDWAAPTACSEWDARALARHVVEEQTWIPVLLEGMSMDAAAEALADELAALERASGPELAARWDALVEPVAAAWAAAGPAATVHLSYGAASADHYLAQQTSDTAIHSWDLTVGRPGRGDRDADWPEDLADALDAFVHADLGSDAASHLFSPAVRLAGSSARDRVLARTGRDPRDWQ